DDGGFCATVRPRRPDGQLLPEVPRGRRGHEPEALAIQGPYHGAVDGSGRVPARPGNPRGILAGGRKYPEHPARLQADRDGYVDPAVHPGRGRQDRALRARPARARARSIPWSGWPESGADHDPAGARDGHRGPQIRGPVGAVPDVRRREDPGHSPARAIRRDHQRWRTPRRVRSSGVERAQPLPTPRAQPVPLPDRAVTADSRQAIPGQLIPGWYGKLPNIGDFASRRLESQFISAWDAWLQEVIQATRGDLGESWLDCYLTMPIWRFLLLPGLVGPSGWAGVLMPSVD